MTLVLAHRGAHAELPENSLAAFAEALLLGADGVELDAASSRTVALLVDLLAERAVHTADQVVVSSFEPSILDEVLAAGGHEVAWLVSVRPGGMDLVTPAVERGYQALHPLWEMVDAGLVAAAHDRGVAVRPWTVNDPAQVTTLAALGVDAVITDDVPAARRALAGAG